jgi:Asp-tRNA(Asn)/Glu-tRNA(Gln) amidotransferase A subunit family amidase
MPESSRLTATQLRIELAKGKLSPREVARAALDVIAQEDQRLHAWVDVKSAAGLEEPLGARDDMSAFPLFGIPVGVKDIFNTRDLKTEYGSEIYRGNRPLSDAACVSRIREAGGVVVGKTATTEFAMLHPCDTRNPLNDKHTPGGSSSGSAAAVAAFMVPLATGTQTGGSVIRPAAYCGVYAIKPTFGIVNRIGVKLVSESIDTIGFFSRGIEDLALILGAATRNDAMSRLAFGELKARAGTVRLAFCRSPQWSEATPEMQKFFVSVEEYMMRTGAGSAITVPDILDGLDQVSDLIIEFEAFDSLSAERLWHAEKCSPHAHKVFANGGTHTFKQYVDAQKRSESARVTIDRLLSEVDCLITLSAPGEAPQGLESTGPPTFNKVWTLLHVPSVNVPAGRGPSGLPFGLQVVAARHKDDIALAGAEKLRSVLQMGGFSA